MIRSILILALASALSASCSRENAPPPSVAADKAPAPAPTSPPANAASLSDPQPGTVGTTPATPAAEAAADAGPAQRERAQSEASAASAAPSPTAAAPSAPAPSAAAPSAPPAPRFREVIIPPDTPITVTLETPVASNTSQIEDQVRGTLARAIVVAGTTVVPAGAAVIGSVTEAKESGRVKGRASVALRFDRLNVRGESHRIQTARIARQAGSSTKSDVTKGGIGAAAGAIIGGIAGGGSGAAIGAGVGGAGAVLATKGKEVELAAGTTLSTRLLQPITVLVPIREE